MSDCLPRFVCPDPPNPSGVFPLWSGGSEPIDGSAISQIIEHPRTEYCFWHPRLHAIQDLEPRSTMADVKAGYSPPGILRGDHPKPALTADETISAAGHRRRVPRRTGRIPRRPRLTDPPQSKRLRSDNVGSVTSALKSITRSGRTSTSLYNCCGRSIAKPRPAVTATARSCELYRGGKSGTQGCHRFKTR